jgi:hypothetical protein
MARSGPWQIVSFTERATPFQRLSPDGPSRTEASPGLDRSLGLRPLAQPPGGTRDLPADGVLPLPDSKGRMDYRMARSSPWQIVSFTERATPFQCLSPDGLSRTGSTVRTGRRPGSTMEWNRGLARGWSPPSPRFGGRIDSRMAPSGPWPYSVLNRKGQALPGSASGRSRPHRVLSGAERVPGSTMGWNRGLARACSPPSPQIRGRIDSRMAPSGPWNHRPVFTGDRIRVVHRGASTCAHASRGPAHRPIGRRSVSPLGCKPLPAKAPSFVRHGPSRAGAYGKCR